MIELFIDGSYDDHYVKLKLIFEGAHKLIDPIILMK